jgi:L-erythro-3,5-diaminohexanoate dehydrogenase
MPDRPIVVDAALASLPASIPPPDATDPFGTQRALEPRGGLPQPAKRVDHDFSRLFVGEMLIAVETLNVDAASFRQMEEAADAADTGLSPADRDAAVALHVEKTVRERGKQHNPVTGSGGMLLGRVLQLAPGRTGDAAKVGDRVATLVSLSLTPLRIDRVKAVRRTSAQIDVEGEAVLFASGAYAKLPADLPERLALAVLDVAGAAPQVARLVSRTLEWRDLLPPKSGGGREGGHATGGSRETGHVREVTVVVLGAGGKSGILCAAEARRAGGDRVKVIGVENHEPFARDLRALGVCDAVVLADACDPVAVRRAVLDVTSGVEADLVFSCVNVPDAEMSAVLITRDRGTAYFFAMSTSFTKAALGAEGVGKDIDLMIGNGYAHGHADHSLTMMREMPAIRALFEKRYG